MFEKTNVNKFDKKIFLEKNLEEWKVTYSKFRDQLLAAKTYCAGCTMGSLTLNECQAEDDFNA